MLFKKSTLFALIVSTSFFVSCSDDDQPIDEPTFNYTTPETYTFERNGVSTVDYSGQKSRILMLDEMGNYIKNQAASGNIVDDNLLSQMYVNTNNSFANADLNSSGKQLSNKTAASYDYFTLFQGGGSTAEQLATRVSFQSTFIDANAASKGNTAAAGVAGYYIDGSSKRLFAANGLEPQQVFLKGMMGACLLDQVVNNYISVAKLDAGANTENNTNKVLEANQTYTTMEHAWDEAYGYIYGADVITETSASYKYWSSYINQVNADTDFNTVKQNIDLAFRKGRAAILANDYKTRDAQANIIKENIALVPAVRAVYYLQEGKAKLTTDGGAKAFHALSEAYGFIIALRYTNKPGTNNPYFSKNEVETMLATLTSGTNGLWDIDNLSPKLDAISTQIATKFGFTVDQAKTVN